MSLVHRRSTKAEYDMAEHMLASVKHYFPDYEPVVTPKQYQRMLRGKFCPEDWNTVRVTEGPPEGISEEWGLIPYIVTGALTFMLGLFMGSK